MSRKEINLESEYLLLHDILLTLRSASMSITSMGSQSEGQTPLYEIQLKTARLHFGTLGLLLNHPEKLRPKDGSIFYANNYTAKKHEVQEIKYKWEDIAAAVDTLKYYKDVEVEITGKWLDLNDKIVKLTEQGLIRFNTKFYLKDYKTEQNANNLHKSIVRTNFWMIILTSVIAISTALPLLCNRSHSKENAESILIHSELPLKDPEPKQDSLSTNQREMNEGLKSKPDSGKGDASAKPAGKKDKSKM